MSRVKNFGFLFLVSFCFSTSVQMVAQKEKKYQKGKKNMEERERAKKQHVVKKVLDNGMTVLVRVVRTIPKVSIQIWYNVGSKDEASGQKGVAHLIEHMIFKGTEKLSESDINTITHKLSGRCNAFTSYDFTGYSFDMPTHHWKKVLPIIADCMQNASFKDEHLNSEMKAVVQELKMIKDQHVKSLVYKLLALIFTGHPYHYPLIGYKKDLWRVRGADLRAFYKKHYLPNNSTLVVSGDVDPQEVFELAEEYFGSIKPDKDYKREAFVFDKDISGKTVSMYRDVQLSTMVVCFVVPGSKDKMDFFYEVLALALANGKSSRLHKKLVDELQLVTSVAAFSLTLFEHGIFLIMYQPKDPDDVEQIESIIMQEIQDIKQDGLQKDELERCMKNAQMDYYSKMEDASQQAYDIGKNFLATGDQEYAFTYMDVSTKQVQDGIKKLLKNFFRKTVMHKGAVLPLPEEEKLQWLKLQQKSDELDTKIMSERIRTTPMEDSSFSDSVTIEEPGVFAYPKPEVFTLSNGVKVLASENNNTPKVDLVLSLKAKSYFDSEEKPGLYNFMMKMLSEGTENYSAAELANELESRGIVFDASPGILTLSMLSQDLEKGLEFLEEILSRATFEKKEMKKVREHIFADIKEFWDNPMHFSGQLIREKLYAGHPYSKNSLGTRESIGDITQKDLKKLYKRFISPDGARLAIVGDFSGSDLKKTLEKYLGKWMGPKVERVDFPVLAPVQKEVSNYPINRDQVTLCFAGLSVDRKHEDYDKLWLLDQIFGGGVLGSMSSRLFKLRENSGLFYGVSGSLKSGANEQPGMVIVRTMVSLDRLEEAQKAIAETIDKSLDQIGKEEFEQARLAISNSLVNFFESNLKTAMAFLFLDRYSLPFDYFDKRAQELSKITIDDAKDAVKKVLDSDKMIVLRVGRVEK